MTNYSVNLLYDDFSTTTISAAKWTEPDGTSGITAGGVNASLAGQTSYPSLLSVSTFDLTAGIIGAQLTSSGTANSNTVFYYEAMDASGNGVGILAAPTATTWSWDTDGSATISGSSAAIANFWGSFTQGNWIGLGITGSIMYWYKSSDGITWTEIGHVTVAGTFAKTAAKVQISAGQLTSTSTWKATIDNVTYFTPAVSVPGKVRVSGAWITPTAVKVRVGGAWVSPIATKVRVGGAWVTPVG